MRKVFLHPGFVIFFILSASCGQFEGEPPKRQNDGNSRAQAAVSPPPVYTVPEPQPVTSEQPRQRISSNSRDDRNNDEPRQVRDDNNFSNGSILEIILAILSGSPANIIESVRAFLSQGGLRNLIEFLDRSGFDRILGPRIMNKLENIVERYGWDRDRFGNWDDRYENSRLSRDGDWRNNRYDDRYNDSNQFPRTTPLQSEF